MFSQSKSLFDGFVIGSLLLISPVFLIQKTWIGFPDHITFLISIILIFVANKKRSRFHSFILIIVVLLGSWNHFYQFLIISFFILIIFSISENKIESNLFYLVFSSFICGRLLSFLFFYIKDIPIQDERLQIIQNTPITEWIRIASKLPHFAILSFFQGALFCILIITFRKNLFILVIFALCYVVAIFTFDTSRIFTNLFYPSLIAHLYFSKKELFISMKDKIIITSMIIFGFLYNLLIPIFYVWGEKLIFLK
jgi:hypothetical protein